MQHHPSVAKHPWLSLEQYEIRVHGELGPGVLASFPGFEAECKAGETILRGSIATQADLHAALEHVETLGLELIEIRRLDDRDAAGG